MVGSGGNPPEARITKSVNIGNGTSVQPGDELVYTVSVKNVGDTDFVNLVVTDTLDSDLDFVSCSDNCTQSTNNGLTTIRWVIDLPIDETRNLELTVRVRQNATGEVKNIATLECPPVTAQGNNLCCPAEGCDSNEIINPIDKGKIAINKEVSNPNPNQNDIITYRIIYKNETGQDLTGVTIVDNIPDGLSYVRDSCNPGCVFNQVDNSLTWNIGNLATNASGEVSFRAMVSGSASGTITNVAVIDSDQTGSFRGRVDIEIRGSGLLGTPRTGGIQFFIWSGAILAIFIATGLYYKQKIDKVRGKFGGSRIGEE